MSFKGLADSAGSIALLAQEHANSLYGAATSANDAVTKAKAAEMANGDAAKLAAAPDTMPILVEDPASASQIALYQAAQAYFDYLRTAHDRLEVRFLLRVTPGNVTFQFPGPTSQDVTIANTGRQAIQELNFSGRGDINKLRVDTSECPRTLPPGLQCKVHVTAPRTNANNEPLTLDLRVAHDGLSLAQIVHVSATYQTTRSRVGAPAAGQRQPPAVQGNGPWGGGAPGAGKGPTNEIAPLEFGVSGAGNAGSANVAPSTSENQLRVKGFDPYTSTSALDLASAATQLAGTFAEMLSLEGDISDWQTLCKPPAGSPTTQGNTAPASNRSATDRPWSPVLPRLSSLSRAIAP